jgi:DNA repair protein RecN (Recombination protein N)
MLEFSAPLPKIDLSQNRVIGLVPVITQLNIQGLAIIESLSIEFSPGFNVITGETGAGKSILIKALNFLLGGKPGSDALRQGSPQATVSGEFALPKGHPALVLAENLGIPVEENAGKYTLIVRRQLTAKGRSQSWVNDVGVTTQPLKELGSTLVDVFGQHENQRLMEPARHVDYVDAFLGDSSPLPRVARLGEECGRLVHELGELVANLQAGLRSQDYLAFRLEEFEKFDPSEEDYQKIHEFCLTAEHMAETKDLLSRAARCLEGGEGTEGGVGQALWEASRLLGQVPQEESTPSLLKDLGERASRLAGELDDLSFELGRHVASLDFDESELEAAQARIFGYQDLFRKHSVREIAELVGEGDRLKGEMNFLTKATENLERLVSDLERKGEEWRQASQALTKARAKAVKVIKKSVESELGELAMAGSRFEAEFTAIKRSPPSLDFALFGEGISQRWAKLSEGLQTISEQGAERVQFLLASNPGEPILPLAHIASGGELSRIMLALKKALVADADTCVLVFDEIDSGISGRVADVVGKKMQELSDDFQVLCISHLPQVAVYADTHFLVRKEGRGNRTESSIVRLSREESAREIARLLSGAELSTPSLANAKSLIDRARRDPLAAQSPAKN